MSGPVRYGSGPRNDPHEGQGGRGSVPFGPEISWPYGFRQLDAESREVLESAYGTGSGYQQPAIEDYGYGDPGYSDPSYEGPKTPYGSPVYGSPAPRGMGGGQRNAAEPRGFGGSGHRGPDPRVPGYHVPDVRNVSPDARNVPEVRDSSGPGYAGRGHQPQAFTPPPAGGQDIWPVTGAQEALPDTGPQRIAEPAAHTGTGNTAYPEQWYGNPRLDDRVLDNPRRDQPRPADPRLEGINYGELRYDDEDPAPGERGYNEPLDDESWYEELRRSAPAYPQSPGDLPRSGGPQGPSGPQRRVEPQGPGFGQPSGHQPPPDRGPGHGQPRGPGWPSGPQMNAGRRPGPASPQGPSAPGAGFLSAPPGPVGVLTPPAGTRIDAPSDSDVFPAAPVASTGTAQFPATARPGDAVRPGHGLDGPEITSSWPAQPQAEDLDSYDDFWREDDDDEYSGLFGDREAERDRAEARPAAKRRMGRRRGGSSDHRLWLVLGGVVVVAAGAITGILKFELPSHSGPAHAMESPAKVGLYTRTVDLEHQSDVNALRDKIIKASKGQASDVKTAVYESGDSAAGKTEQIIMFVGGHLANADPAVSIQSFMQQYRGATLVSAGPLGGKAACVQGAGKSSSGAMCAFFDNDSFGELVSPTMDAKALASAMNTIRPAVEIVVKK